MDAQKVDLYLLTNQKYFPADKMLLLKERMMASDDTRFMLATSQDMKDPTVILVLSLLLGYLGIDRFMLGETGMGILKLLTSGCCGILTIIDWFTCQKKAREINFQKVMMIL